MATILAVESSCDDTSASIWHNGQVCSNVISSQGIHSSFGGVVPELASRDHQKNIMHVVQAAMHEAGVSQKDLSAVAFTRGPGLLGSLLVGISFAKGLAMSLNIPLIEVDHLKAHMLAHFIDDPKPAFPFLCLLVSGGHTQLVLLKNPLEHEVLGTTQDDAAGEAFDKGAKILGLPYPGGPIIDQHATKGNPQAFSFNYPKAPGYNYSFSGLKTALLYFLRDNIKIQPDFITQHLADLCASWQFTIVDYLLSKAVPAIENAGVQHFGIAGGVAANSYLRRRVSDLEQTLGIKTYVPQLQYCLDNAGMIAQAASYEWERQHFTHFGVKPFTRHA